MLQDISVLADFDPDHLVAALLVFIGLLDRVHQRQLRLPLHDGSLVVVLQAAADALLL